MYRLAVRHGAAVSRRSITTTASTANASSPLSLADKEKYYPKIGNREIVGYGFNGHPCYVDREEFPAPAIRFRAPTAETEALREKEKGDWKNLTLEEKKMLYRASFCQTFAEMKAPTGEWKSVLAGILLGISVTGWAMVWLKRYVYPDLPPTITKEWQEAQTARMVVQRQGHIDGVSSKYDYDKMEWK